MTRFANQAIPQNAGLRKGRTIVNKELKATLFVLALGGLALLAGICWWIALTAPMMASDGPIVLSIFVTVVAFLLWRQRRRFV